MLARAEAGRLAITLALAGLVAGFVPACAKNREPSAPPESPPVSDDIAAIEARLSSNAQELQREGVALDEGKLAKAPSGATVGGTEAEADDEAGAPARDAAKEDERQELQSRMRTKRGDRARPRCERICDLAASTCELRGRICDLAQVHEGEARYEDACERAAAQCQAAQTACTRCR